MKKKVIKGLFDFLKSVHEFEHAITAKYSLTDIPLNHVGSGIPSTGEIEVCGANVRYRFHGLSCNLENEKFSLDYCNNIGSENRIGVTLFYFVRYLQSWIKDDEIKAINPKAPIIMDAIFTTLKNEGFIEEIDIMKGMYFIVEAKIVAALN